MIIQNLLDFYNFASLSQLPLIQVDFHRVDTYPPIQQILSRICCFSDQIIDSEKISENYLLLNECTYQLMQLQVSKRRLQALKGLKNLYKVYLQQQCNMQGVHHMQLLNVLREESQEKSTVYFHLTYYRKNCVKYVDCFSSCSLMTVGLITGYKLEQWNEIDEKIKQLRSALRQLSKIQEHYNNSIFLNRLCSLVEASTTYHLGSFKKAKDLCSKIINTSSLQSISAIKAHKEPSSLIKLQLTLCSYTVMKIYEQMGNYELQMLMMNKFLEYVQKFYSGGQTFLELITKGDMKPKEVRVKLTRLQEKIRRIQLTEEEQNNKYLTGTNKVINKKKNLSRSTSLYNMPQNSTLTKSFSNLSKPGRMLSLHKQSKNQVFQRKSSQNLLNKNLKQQQNTQKKSTVAMFSLIKGKQSATNKLKLTKRPMLINTLQNNPFQSSSTQFNDTKNFTQTQPVFIKNQVINPIIHQKELKKSKEMQVELQNLLILKDNKKNYYRLKQETLKYLSKQSNQLKRMIRIKNNEINQIQQYKTNLTQQLNMKQLKNNIEKSKKQEALLMKQINAKKWNYLETLPQVKKINSCFKTFLTTLTYWHSKNVYSLVYGEIINVPQMKLITTLRQKIQKKSKQVISQIVYRNIKHQVEYIKQQLSEDTFVYIMNIYQTQKGQNGINLQFQLSQQDYKIVKYEPFYFNYTLSEGKLVPFEKQLLQLSLRSIFYVKKFIKKMKQCCLKSEEKVAWKVCYVGFNYQNETQLITKEMKQKSVKIKQYAFVGVYFITTKQICLQNDAQGQNAQLSQQQNESFQINPQNNNNILEISTVNSNFFQTESKFFQDYKQQEHQKMIQVTVEKISSNKRYHNKNYNSPLLTKVIVSSKKFDELNVIKSVLTQQMNSIFAKHYQQIIKIQTIFRKVLAKNQFQSRKNQTHVETYHHKGVLYTIIIDLQNNKNIFFIENISRPISQEFSGSNSENIFSKFMKFSTLIRRNVQFQSLQFLSRLQPRLEQSTNFEEMYNRIEKFMKIKLIASKVFSKTKDIRLFTDFQTQFKKKLCFATIKNEFLFRGKMREGRIMYMLTVKQFSRMPRPYSLRIFTLESNSMISIDGQKIIYNKQKIFLESKLQTINQVIQILGRNEFEIITKIKMEPMMKKTPSRISILSNYSFHSVDQSREHIDDKISSGGINRRMSKNSMFTKFRHKALIKNQDLEAIKKLVEERNLNHSQNSSSQHSSQLSIVEPVISDSSEDKGTQQRSS